MGGAGHLFGRWWISASSIVVVAGYLVVAAWSLPAPAPRAALHTSVVFALGYGHLLASVARRRRARAASDGRRDLEQRSRQIRLVSIVVLCATYALYAELCRVWPLVPLVLLAVSAWHTVENDRAIRRARLDDPSPIAPLSAERRDVIVDVSSAGALGALALGLPLLISSIDVADVVVAFILHHLVTWLLLVIGRARVRREVPATLMHLARLHLPMMCVLAASTWVSTERNGLPEPIPSIGETLLSPATYLFWSAAHVVHTAWRRSGG